MPSPVDLLVRTAGGTLAAATSALGAARERVKPLHPAGELHHATVTRMPAPIISGVPWLDAAGTDEAVVRTSRAIGLPEQLPDFQGLAIRLLLGGADADILLASTGTGRLTRYLLAPTRRRTGRALTTLLPYRSPRGPLLLAAVPDSPRSFELSWAGTVGPWHRFGRLELGAPYDDDPAVSFDPILNVVPGLEQYGWVRTLREPAYWTARNRTGRSAVRRPTAFSRMTAVSHG